MGAVKGASVPANAADGAPLAWEHLGSVPAAGAFRQALAGLLWRPHRFFARMAVTGGLYEPLTFFAILLAAAVAVAFPAALSYYGVAAPDRERVSADVYRFYVLPARVTGLLLVLLPLVVVAGSAAMVLLGSLYHAGAKAFGARNWEGSVSVWLYSAGAALAPPVAALAVFLPVCLAGYLLSLQWPEVHEPAASLAHWMALALGSAGLLGGAAALIVDLTVGCGQASRLEPQVGAAAGVAGLAVVVAATGGVVWTFGRWGPAWGLAAAAACLAAGGIVAALSRIAARRAEGSPAEALAKEGVRRRW